MVHQSRRGQDLELGGGVAHGQGRPVQRIRSSSARRIVRRRAPRGCPTVRCAPGPPRPARGSGPPPGGETAGSRCRPGRTRRRRRSAGARGEGVGAGGAGRGQTVEPEGPPVEPGEVVGHQVPAPPEQHQPVGIDQAGGLLATVGRCRRTRGDLRPGRPGPAPPARRRRRWQWDRARTPARSWRPGHRSGAEASTASRAPPCSAPAPTTPRCPPPCRPGWPSGAPPRWPPPPRRRGPAGAGRLRRPAGSHRPHPVGPRRGSPAPADGRCHGGGCGR